MCTARLPTVLGVSAGGMGGGGGGGGGWYPEMNKFEKVFSDDHQISVMGPGVGVPK